MGVACQTMLTLINDLLDIAAIEAGRLELQKKKVDIEQYLRETCESNSILAEAKKIRLVCAVEENLPPVLMDPNRINQVINNLITNAIKFSHPETQITVSAKKTDEGIVIAVTDQGQGIPASEIPKLFAAFSRTSVQATAGEKSTGLGLMIVKRLVEVHGGRVWVESVPGKGSTFALSLPLDN